MQGFNKIGFHLGPGGNATGIGDWMRQLDSAKVPFFLKSVDNYGPCHEAAGIAQQSGLPHTIVFRLSTLGQGDGYDYDVPPYKEAAYSNDPIGGAELHWQKTKAKLPPEFDKSVWIEPINEVDKTLCDWLGKFAVHLANLAQQDGYKVALFAWSSGEPEVDGWEQPGMMDYLRLCAARPEQAAIALHEYSYDVTNINNQRPFLIGRFQQLFDVCDRARISRPTILITEWGWELDKVPAKEQALQDIEDIAQLYALQPQIKGAAIWYLGPGFGDIANQAQKLIQPLTAFSLTTRFDIPDTSDSARTKPPVETPKQTPNEPISHTINPVGRGKADAKFLNDVTIPDNSAFPSGTVLTKTWRVQNTGNLSWDERYHLVNTGDKQLTAVANQPLPPAEPGEEVDISVTITIPSTSGTYTTIWKLQDSNGRYFGDRLFAQVVAQPPAVPPTPTINNSQFITDVTIPDDTPIAGQAAFVKTWRLKNNGTSTWGNGYSLSFSSGTLLSANAAVSIPITLPGAEVDISVPMVAPKTPGSYTSTWRLKDQNGQFFGDFAYVRITATAAPRTNPITNLKSGVDINPDAPNSNPVDSQELAGADWVRLVFKYAARQNPAERTDLNAALRQYDPIVQKYAALGVACLFVLNQETVWGNAPWSGNGDWATYGRQLADTAGQIASHYAAYGRKVGYEIWNEGDLPNNPASVYVPPQQFALVLKPVSDAIRAVSPQSPLVSGGLATGPTQGIAYLKQCLVALDGQWPVDAIGIHPYGRWATRAPFDWGNTFGTLGDAFEEYQREIPNMPFWITEIGVAADSPIGPPYYQEIGDYILDVYQYIGQNYGHLVPVVLWFAWSDWMRNAGVVTKEGLPKAHAYDAFQTVIKRRL